MASELPFNRRACYTRMPRRPRGQATDLVYHVLNRAVRRALLFQTPADYAAFEQVLLQALQRVPLRLLAYCAMPNHWHLVVWPTDRRRAVSVHALADVHPRATLALFPRHSGHWSSLPGTIQGNPCGIRPSSSPRLSIRRAKSSSRGSCATSGGLALVKSLAALQFL